MAVPKKYEHINFKPPQNVANAAERGLEYRRRSGKGGLSSQEAGKAGIGSGVQRAVNLKNRNNIAPETFSMMSGFFSRHEKNKKINPENKETPWEDAGHVAWLLWGGDPGKKWVDKIKKQMADADEKEKKEKEEAKKKKASSERVAFIWRVAKTVRFTPELFEKLAQDIEMTLANLTEGRVNAENFKEWQKAVVKLAEIVEDHQLSLEQNEKAWQQESYNRSSEEYDPNEDKAIQNFHTNLWSPMFRLQSELRIISKEKFPKYEEWRRENDAEGNVARAEKIIEEALAKGDKAKAEQYQKALKVMFPTKEQWDNEIGVDIYIRNHKRDLELIFEKINQIRENLPSALEDFKKYTDRPAMGSQVYSETPVSMYGFDVILVDEPLFDQNPNLLKKVQAVMKMVSQRVSKRLPLLNKVKTAIRFVPSEQSLNVKYKGVGLVGTSDAFYDSTTKEVTVVPKGWVPSGEKVITIAQRVIHELGHHVYQRFLIGAQRDYWKMVIKDDRKRKVPVEYILNKIREHDLGSYGLGNVTNQTLHSVFTKDPEFHMDWMYLINSGQNYDTATLKHLFETEELTHLTLPKNPISAYGATNDEEAFCEAFGNYIVYGSSYVTPLVASWLKTVLPQFKLASSERVAFIWREHSGEKKASARRVARLYLQADLNPGLGISDSACDVLRRIDNQVRNPALKDDLIELVEDGHDLTNAEAYKIYKPITESGYGKSKFKRIEITPHAQYRMDYRGIDVKELNMALYEFQKVVQRDISQKGWSRWEDRLEDYKVAFVDSTKLKVVFEPLFRKDIPTFDNLMGAVIVSAYYLNQYPSKVTRQQCGL